MAQSAYIHIPFCLSKCNYCSFVSFPTLDKKIGYLYSLLKEIDYYYAGETLDTLYFGGGTPSLFTPSELQKILKKFNLKEAEVTIEINPDTVDETYISNLKDIGFTRLSIGVQSFNDSILQNIGRRHNSDKALEVIKSAKKYFENISVDLIYGLPNQTLSDFEKDLEIVNSLDIQHVSLYGLKIDEGCYFYNNYPENVPDEDVQADMYLLAIDKLKDFNHYEVSNWGKSGFMSRHNSNYWLANEYYGFGVSAHGYVDGVRYSNYCTLEEYMEDPTRREYGEFLTDKKRLEEKIFLGLRLADGIDVSVINEEFEIDFEEEYKTVIHKYLSTGHLIKTNNGYRFSNQGFLVSNVILAEFL